MQLANNYDFYNFYQNVDYLQGLQDATGYSQLLTKTQTTFVKRSKYDCYEDNSMYLTNCINEFYAKQLKCNLPWATNMDPDLNHCESEDELEKFRMLSVEITLPNLTEKIKDMRCIKPNCLQTTWTKKRNEEQWATETNETMKLNCGSLRLQWQKTFKGKKSDWQISQHFWLIAVDILDCSWEPVCYQSLMQSLLTLLHV